MNEQLKNELLVLFDSELELEVPSVKLDLMESGYLDSLNFVHLTALIEEKYGIRIEVEDLEISYFQSIENIAEFISSRTAGSSRPGHLSARASEIKMNNR